MFDSLLAWIAKQDPKLVAWCIGSTTILLVVLWLIELTQKKRFANKLAQQQSLLREFMSIQPEWVLLLNGHGTVIGANTPALERIGCTLEEAQGRTIPSLLPALQKLAKKIDTAVQQHKRFEQKNVVVDSRTYDVIVLPLPLSVGEGSLVRIADITAQTHLDATLIRAGRMISLGSLATGTAHEVNNMLSGILQGTQNIHRRISASLPANAELAKALGCNLDQLHAYMEQRGILRLLQGIRTSGQQAAATIASMLEFSKPDRNRSTPHNIHELLGETLALARNDYTLKYNYDFRRISITVDILPDLSLIPCSETEIQQALLALLQNAAEAIMVRHTNMSQGSIAIHAYQQDGHCTITIADNGAGMTTEQLGTLYNPLSSNKNPDHHFGLGLYIAHYIFCHNHKGTMQVSSTPENGTTFVISIPHI